MCGVFGMICKNCCRNTEPAELSAYGLLDLQHRGQQGCGICTQDDVGAIHSYRGSGSVTRVFELEDVEMAKEIISSLPGRRVVGQALYSTVGQKGQRKQPRSFQPQIGELCGEQFALSYNGNHYDFSQLKGECKKSGYEFRSEDSDTEVVVGALSTCKEWNMADALKSVLPRLKGAFAFVILHKGKMYGTRDQFGIRPLCLAIDRHKTMLASETCAFSLLGAEETREIQPGEIIVVGDDGVEETMQWTNNTALKFCMLEYIYFARPDSEFCGQSVCSYRDRAGALLAESGRVDVDLVIPVPESGRIYDDAYAHATGIRNMEGLFRNRHIDIKTFLATRDTDKLLLQERKIRALRAAIFLKRLLLVEDSIIRGNVLKKVLQMCRRAGAWQTHVAVGSAPIMHPCFYGIDMPTELELIAAGRSIEEVRKIICADSLHYLTLDNMVKATGLPRENLCLACFTGEYPVPPPIEV